MAQTISCTIGLLKIITEQEHLGIIRNSKRYQDKLADTRCRVKMGRPTVYSLMGAGLYGLNSVNPGTYVCTWNICATSNTVWLEVMQNPGSEITKLEKCQREMMRQVQFLLPGVSNPITYLLAGVLPIKGTLYKRNLTTFCSMLRDKNTSEYKIMKRQLALKDDNSKSWIVIVKKLLYQYHLPSTRITLFEHCLLLSILL